MKNFSEEKLNPFRDQNWRFERVLKMVDRIDIHGEKKAGRCTAYDDKYVKGLRNFILRYRVADDLLRNQLFYTNHGCYIAYRMNEHRRERSRYDVTVLESMVLARCTQEEIAKELDIHVEAVEWYEALFFDVRSKLNAKHWIVSHVIVPAYMAELVDEAPTAGGRTELQFYSVPFFDSLARGYAYFYGPIALDQVITTFQMGTQLTDAVETKKFWENDSMVTNLRRGAGLNRTVKINRYNALPYLEVHNQVMNMNRNVNAQQQQLSGMEKNISALLLGIPWAYGREGVEIVKGTAIEKYDNSAVDLRDSELALVAAGQTPSTIEGVEDFVMPAPRVKDDKEKANANAK